MRLHETLKYIPSSIYCNIEKATKWILGKISSRGFLYRGPAGDIYFCYMTFRVSGISLTSAVCNTSAYLATSETEVRIRSFIEMEIYILRLLEG